MADNDKLPAEAPPEDPPAQEEAVKEEAAEEVEVAKKKADPAQDCPKCEECAPCKPGAPAWMATFADMATLLMAFFVLILSFAEMNVPKFKQISGSLKNSFGVQRLIPVVESPKAQSLIARNFSPSVAESTLLDTIRQQTTEDRLENVELKTDVAPPSAQQAIETLRQALAQEISRGEAEVKFQGGKVVVEITATPSGSAGPKGSQQGGNASGAQQGGAAANGAQQGGASASGAQQAGAAASGNRQAGSAAKGAQQAGVVQQGEIEFYAKVAEAQAQVATAVEVRDVRGAAKDSSGQRRGGVEEATSAYQRLRAEMSKEIESGKVEIERDGARVIVRLTEQGAFPSGRADLQPGFMKTLGQVAQSLGKTRGRVFIEGHTDNVPVMFSDRFRSNWDLSGARAGAVADYMSANGLAAGRISVAGYADTRPIDSNDSANGRSRNRRIEVIIDGADK